MNSNQIKLFNRMKDLIRNKKRRFKIRKDRNIKRDLFDLDLTEDKAWKIICNLNPNNYFRDPIFSHHKSNNNTLTFKRLINCKMVYIKLELEFDDDGEETVCWSFHEDHR